MKDTIKLIEYSRTIADEFQVRLNRVRTFVPAHYLTSGTANEAILREFLAEMAPKRFEVGQGFICDPTQTNHVSKQCDILIYDRLDYPLVYAEGDVKIVWPDSAKLVIEIKTTLEKDFLYDALRNIASAKRMKGMTIINGLIFAFNSKMSAETIITHLQNYSDHYEMRNAPNAILVLDEKLIVTSHKWQTALRSSDKYEILQCNDSGILITYLILFFFANTSGGLLQATIVNAMRDLLSDQNTTHIGDLVIGEKVRQS